MQLLLRHISAQKLMSKPLGSVRLKTLDVSENSHIKKDLFYNQQEEKIIIGCQNLVCRLKERLGEGIVFFLEKVSSHRPEQNFYCTNVNSHGLKSSTTCGSARPLWLVKKPIKLSVTNQQPQYQGALTIKIERERILSNWWEHTIIARDYFIASTARGNRIWIYKEIGVANSWYLQGFFD
jgi:protein ImuB